MKKMKTENGLHEIKNKKRLRAVKDKKRGMSLKRVKSRRKAKAVASLLFVGALGLAFAFLGSSPNLNVISKDFVTVCCALPTDGSTPVEHSGVENVSYMNYRLKGQTEWYSQMHSDVKTNMGSIGDQSVDTYKQFSNSVLVQTDIATSAVVNEAQQFCWIPDDAQSVNDFSDGVVMWRTTTKNKSAWKDYTMPWPDGTYSFNRKSINAFTYGCAEEGQKEVHGDEINGLPGTAFSVYVIREETVESAEDVVLLEDGLYSQTFHLRVKPTSDDTDDSAVCHYRNQMIFKGGLSSLPTFDYVTVTYTFDSTWQIYSCQVAERYSATMSAISVTCTSTSKTVYEYGTEKSQHTAYEEYFKYQYDRPVTDSSKEISNIDCLSSAFGPMLTEPTTLSLTLDVGGYTLDGLVGLDLATMDIRASFQDGALRVWYSDDGAYLALGELKIKLEAEELSSLFGGVSLAESDGDSKESGLSLDFLLEQIANAELEREGDKASMKTSLDLSSIISGLKVSDLEFNFNIGEGNAITLEDVKAQIQIGNFAIGARMSFSDKKVPALFEEEKSGYADGLPYVNTIAEIVKSGAVDISLGFEAKDISVAGNLSLSFSEGLAAKGALTVEYGGASIPVSLYCVGGEIYLNAYGLKVKTSISALFDLISNADLGESSSLKNLLGKDFSLNDIKFAAKDDGIEVNVLGANLKIAQGEKFEIDEDFTSYVDIMPAASQILDIIAKHSVAISGKAELAFGETAVSLEIAQGAVSWQNGLDIYLDILLGVNGVEQNVILKANKDSVKIAYGSVGVDLAFDELGNLKDAFKELYGKLRDTINQAAQEGGFLPEDYHDLYSLLGSVIDLSDCLDAETDGIESGFDLGGLIAAIAISSPDNENGICKISYENLTAQLLGANGKLGLELGYASDSLNVSASLSAGVLESEMPEMPEANYLTVADFAEMLDYVAAAANTLAQTELKITASATIANAEAGDTAIDATVLYHTGGEVLFKIDQNNQTVTVTTDLYLNVSLSIVSENSDTNTYLDLLVFDYGNDEELDFFVRLSKFDPSDERYDPLLLSAPASEIMTMLSAGLSLFGVNTDILNNYLVYHWLEAETTEQLLAFGEILKKSLGLENGFLGLASNSESAVSDTRAEVCEPFIRSIVLDKENGTFTVKLNSSAVYGKEGLEDITFQITKENGLLGAVSLNNVYSGNASEVTNVSVTIDTNVEKTEPVWLNECFKIEGINPLLKALANTATHEETKEDGTTAYVMNDNFYIEGVVSVNLTAVGFVNIDIDVKVAVSVDLNKDGSVLIKARLDYNGKSVPLVGTAINGDTNRLDLTIDLQESMIYMKRVETTNHKDTVEYRAMPLKVFVKDIMNQLAFMLNFGPLITKNLPTDISSDEGESKVVDFGTMKNQYLSGLEFAGNENDGYQWTMKLNGSTLTGGAMSDIVVEIATAKDGNSYVLKTLGLTTSVSTGSSVGDAFVKIDISTGKNPLTIRNPKGVMESGYSDITSDISSKLIEAIGKAYDEAEKNDWLKVDENGEPVKDEKGNYTYVYISGVLTTVSFMLGDEVLGTQDVLFDGITYELYAKLNYPDASAYEIEGYSIVWNKIEGKIEPNQLIYAYYAPNSYRVTLVSEKPLDGFAWNENALRYELAVTYVYNDGFYCGDAKLAFPEADVNGWRIAYFEDEAGNVYRSLDGADILCDTALTAVWEMVDYTVSYNLNGTTTVQTAHYGDAFAAPDTALAGHTFLYWQDESGNTYADLGAIEVTGSAAFTAVYSTNVYNVTLVSDYEIEGFTQSNGVWTKKVSYTFGTQIKLPSGIETADGHFLNGFTLEGQSEVYVYVPEVVQDVPLYANWSEVKYKITYVVNGETYATQNYDYGDSLSLPAFDETTLNYRLGYEPYWVVDGDYFVTGNDTISANYRAKTYTVSVYSTFELKADLFDAWAHEQTTDGFVYTYSYTYDGNTASLPESVKKVKRFDFKGFFYTPEYVEETEVTQIDNGIIEHLALYAYWFENTVTVTLWSDVAFEGSEKVLTAYRANAEYYDGNYTVGEITAAGYQQIGWFYHDEEKNEWSIVSEVSDFMGQTIELWAVWIQDILVTINSFNKSNSTYTLGGTVSGGTLFGANVAEISKAINLTDSGVKGVYYIAGNKKQVDHLESGKEQNIEDSTFSNNNMTSWDALWWSGGATYGGIVIKKTFTYTDANGNEKSIITKSGAMVARDQSYTVNFVDESGETLSSTTIAVPCDTAWIDALQSKYDYCKDCTRWNTYASLDNLAPSTKKEGYTFLGWRLEDGTVIETKEELQKIAITNGTTVTVLYAPET